MTFFRVPISVYLDPKILSANEIEEEWIIVRSRTSYKEEQFYEYRVRSYYSEDTVLKTEEHNYGMKPEIFCATGKWNTFF